MNRATSKTSRRSDRRTPVGLLVSVRDALEAEIALRGGADWIDVKEPLHGPLGHAEPAAISQVVRAVDKRAPISVALGEVVDHVEASPGSILDNAAEAEARRSIDLPRTVQLAKFGLAGCRSRSGWRETWARACGTLPAHVGSVAVCYADWRTADAPCPEDVAELARVSRCRAILVDTYDKSNGSLFDYWSPALLGSFLNQVRESGKLVVLGGSLSSTTLATAVALRPDFIAVRGAVCDGGRKGRVRLALVREMASRIDVLSANLTATEQDGRFFVSKSS